MSYNREEKYKEAIDKIKENNLYFASDVIACLGIADSTFYEWWKPDSDESNNIKRLLELNRTNTKIELREGFRKGASVEKLALYKLIGTDEERKKLSQQHTDITTDGERIQININGI